MKPRSRSFSVHNESTEDVPPFGLMRLKVEADCQREIGGQAVWLVDKPDADCEARQDPALLFVNGPVPIRADSYGVGSQAWPMRVQLGDTVADGDPCGPKASSWFAWSTGSAFTLLTNDHMDDLAESTLDVGWVAASLRTVILPATLSANLTSGNSANATLLVGASRANSGVTVAVYDLPAFIPSGEQIVSGSDIRVYYDRVAGKFVLLTSSVCSTDIP